MKLAEGDATVSTQMFRPILLALEAVKQWRYQPFLLNGDPIVVKTTITVVFSLSE